MPVSVKPATCELVLSQYWPNYSCGHEVNIGDKYNWNTASVQTENRVVMTFLPTLVLLEVVIMINWGASNDNNITLMTTSRFQCIIANDIYKCLCTQKKYCMCYGCISVSGWLPGSACMQAAIPVLLIWSIQPCNQYSSTRHGTWSDSPGQWLLCHSLEGKGHSVHKVILKLIQDVTGTFNDVVWSVETVFK